MSNINIDDTDYDIKDALIYSSIDNIITPTNFLNKDATYWKTNQRGTPDSNTSITDGYINFTTMVNATSNNRDASLQNILNKTTIKRACCLKDEDPNNTDFYKVTVKLPYNDNIVSGTDILKNTLYKKYGFFNKEVKIPKTMCDSNYIGPEQDDGKTNNCDSFYRTYCENVKHMYANNIKQTGEPYDSAYLHVYAPDCACFMDTPETNTNVQPACYAPSCLTGGRNIYRDRETRSKGACTINQCNSFIDMGGLLAASGGSIGLTTNVNQTCGEFKNEHENLGSDAANKNNDLLGKLLNDNNLKSSPTPTTTKSSTLPTSTSTSTSNNDYINISNYKILKKNFYIGSGILLVLICCCCIISLIFLFYSK